MTISQTNAQSFSRTDRFFNPIKSRPIIEMKTFGGYCRGQCPESKVQIFNNGAVKVTEITFKDPILNRDGTTSPGKEVKKAKLAVLSKTVLSKLKVEINKIQGESELKDTNPSGPRCSDSATTTYSIFKGGFLNYRDRKQLKLAEDKGCKNFVREGNEGYKIVNLIKSFRSVASILDF